MLYPELEYCGDLGYCRDSRNDSGLSYYQMYTCSNFYYETMTDIMQQSLSVYHAIKFYKIPDNFTDSSYDFKTVLDNLPNDIKVIVYDNPELYYLVCELADGYYVFAKGKLEYFDD